MSLRVFALCLSLPFVVFASPARATLNCGQDYSARLNNYGGSSNSVYASNAVAFAALKSDGTIAAWGREGDGGSDAPTGSGYISISSNHNAFAALKSDGSIDAWGETAYGGSNAPTDSGYVDIYSNTYAFAAIKADGSITAWGGEGSVGAPTDAGYTDVYSNSYAFAALRPDGSINAWGGSGGTGEPTDSGYVTVFSTSSAFAALKADGSISAWGSSHGGTGAPTDAGYVTIFSGGSAFAALKSDGSITVWGSVSGSPTDAGYTTVHSNGRAFAALKSDGSIFAWGDADDGGTGAPTDTGYTHIYAAGEAFAATKADGSISVWGNPSRGGSGAPTDNGYTYIYGNGGAFAAIKSDGSITGWGSSTFGGNSAPTDSGYVSVSSVSFAFAGMKSDGSIHAWGNSGVGGSGEPTDAGYLLVNGTNASNSTSNCVFRLPLALEQVIEDIAGNADGVAVTAFILNSIDGVSGAIPANESAYTPALQTGSYTDSANPSAAEIQAVVTAVNTNDAPTVDNPISDQSVNEDSALSFAVPANTFGDVDSGDTLSLSVTSTLPAWLSFNTGTSTFSGTPTNDDVGAVAVTVQASDGIAAVSDSFTLTVVNTNDAPTVDNPISDQSIDEDSALSFAVPANTFGDVDVGDTLNLSVTSTLPGWLSFNTGSNTFSGTPTNGDVGAVLVTVQASDGTATVSDNFTLTVDNSNDAPTVDAAVPGQSATEDAVFSFTIPSATFGDVDAGDTLSYTAPTLPSWLSFNASSRTLSGTPSNNHVGDNAVVVRATDTAGATADAPFNISVGNVNDAPTLDQGIADQVATEDVAFSFNVPANAFADPDAGDVLSYTLESAPGWLSISGNTLSGTPVQADVGAASISLRATDSGTLFSDASFTLTVAEVNDNAPVFSSATAINVDENTSGSVYTASASDADSNDTLAFSLSGADAALFSLNASTGALAFVSAPDFEAPQDSGGNNVFDLTLSATDAATNSSDLALTITLLDVNDVAPSFSSAATFSAPEGSGSTGYIASATDPDTADTLAFAISGGADSAHFQIHASTGVLSFAHPLDFESPQDANADNVYELTLRARDAAANDTLLPLALTLTDTNDNAPSFSSATAVSVDENSAVIGYTATATDPDSGDTIAFAIEPGQDGALFSIDSATGVLTFNAAPDFESPADADTDNTYLLTLSATDTALLKSTHTLAVSVRDLNDTVPSFVSLATASISEDNFSVGYTALASDPDSEDATALSLRYSIVGGADAALFSLNDTTGLLTFISAPDFETPDDDGADHVYQITLQVVDNAAHTAQLPLSITLTDANDNAPLFTSAAQAVIPEGSTGVFYTATATDPDSVDSVSFSITAGNNAGLFSIDSVSGALSVSDVDFEQPGSGSANNVYTLTLRGTDTGANTKDYVLAITVEDVNDTPPVITSSDLVQMDENSSATGYTASASDADIGDSLSWAFGGGADDALFNLDPSSGVLSFAVAPDAEVPGDQGTDNVYNVTLRALDGAGNSSDLPITVTVNNLNDNTPLFSSATALSIDEGSTASPYTAVASDADVGDAVQYTLTGGSDVSLFLIDSASGVLTLAHALDAEAPEDSDADNQYQLSISATDSGGLSQSLALTVSVDDINDTAPSISSATSATLAEGHTATGYTASATDPDSGDTVSYTLSGTDAALFNLDANTGTLSLLAAADFESPADNDTDNQYQLTLTATDAVNNSSNQALVVSVTDINDETPVFSSATTASVSEGSTAAFYAAQASDSDAGDTLSYSLSGADAAAFSIDSASGALRLNASSDFENPTDADANNTYALTLTATDAGGNVQTLLLSVTLSNVNEAPSAQDQLFSVGEFAGSGTAVGTLIGADPENDSLQWQLLTAGSPFSLSSSGVLSVSSALDHEDVPSYTLSVQLSDGALSANTSLTVSVDDENEISRLLQDLPVTVAELSAEGVTGAVLGRESYYNDALGAAAPLPSTLSALQTLIDQANAVAETVDQAANGAAGSTDSLMASLQASGISGLDPANAAAYQRAIASAVPPPSTPAEMQTLVERTNAVAQALAALEQLHSGADTSTGGHAALASALQTVGATVPDHLLGELAALINRSSTPPSTGDELVALSNALLNRATNHPVLYLRVSQDGGQVLRIRPDGGLVTVTAQIANPVLGLAPSFDWQATSNTLLLLASDPNPSTDAFVFDPSSLGANTTHELKVGVTRDSLLAHYKLAVHVAPIGTPLAEVRDSDGDGVLDSLDSELNANTDPSHANQIQTLSDNAVAFNMEGETGTVLRLGRIARAAQTNQTTINLEQLIAHTPGATVAQVIDALPTVADPQDAQVFDFEIAALPRAGASVTLVIPLEQPLNAYASYVKYHPATGWQSFVEDGLNRLRSAEKIGGLNGLCPPPKHSAYRDGLIEGHACIELTLEDGGPNDADRLNADGSPAVDAGLNGNIQDPAAIAYTDTAASGGTNGVVKTGGSGGGSIGLLWCLIAWARTRYRPMVRCIDV